MIYSLFAEQMPTDSMQKNTEQYREEGAATARFIFNLLRMFKCCSFVGWIRTY